MHSRGKKATNTARALRKRMSRSERRMWGLLRRDLLGFRFRRQFPVRGYFLDFYCSAAKLCIEVDGDFHSPMPDAARDADLAKVGIMTIRVPASVLFQDTKELTAWIQHVCTQRTQHTTNPETEQQTGASDGSSRVWTNSERQLSPREEP